MRYKSVTILAMAMSGVGYAGDELISSEKHGDIPMGEERDWCDFFDLLGTPIYDSPSNPLVQEFKFYGRAQYQWGHTEGDFLGRDFEGDGDEIRRLRLGAQVKFLNNFVLKGNVNLEDGGFRNHGLDYDSVAQVHLTYTLGDVAGFEDVKVGYGRYKIGTGSEGHTSSRKIKTIERSNISNFYFAENSTGVRLEAERAGIDWTLGVYTTDRSDSIGSWDEGVVYFVSSEFEAVGGDVILDLAYSDADPATDEDSFGYGWVGSVGYETKLGEWSLVANAIYGEAHNGDGVYGLVLMPSLYLIEDKLEAVVRYQFAGSDGDNIKINNRNVRNVVKHDIGISLPSGDTNHTIYGGLNYYLCRHHAKIMTGVEYETLETSRGWDTDALTFWTAFRMYF